MKRYLKPALKRVPAVDAAVAAWKARRLVGDYRRRRDHYHGICRQAGLKYDPGSTTAAVRDRLRQRGYTVARKRLGGVHTFAFIPRLGWHRHLIPDLHELGAVTEFDYVELGYDVTEWFRPSRDAVRRRDEMNARVLPALREAHRRNPVDWVFVYASGREIGPETIASIQDELGIPVVTMCLDDKQSWQCERVGAHRAGQIDLAPVVDLSWTSARVACEWYLAEQGRPLYLPEGCNAQAYVPRDVAADIPVSFIGSAYGFRSGAVNFLRRAGIPVEVFGPGWGTRSVWGEEAVEILSRSRINLGMGGIGASETLTNVKTRDFEVPCAGGGLYVTSFNADLAQHFDVGREIVCYRSRDEMLELIRYYLDRPDERREIAARARERCLAEHRWLHRYVSVLQVLGVL